MRQPRQRGDRELLVLEWIARRVAGRDRGATFLVEDREAELEASAQLDEPLHQQGIRQHDQHAGGAAGGQHARDQHARLDGLAEAGLVGQQRARVFAFHAGCHHTELVRQQVDARGQAAPGIRAPRLRARQQCLLAQFVMMRLVHPCRHQARVGLRQ